MIFLHDYYYPPNKDGKSTVLCMRCAKRIKAPGMSKEQVESNYREKPITWSRQDGFTAKGVLLVCPDCLNIPITEENSYLIHKQVMKALEDEAKWAKLPFKNDLMDMKILHEEAA